MIFNCPRCGKRIKVSDEKAGKKGKCPGCHEVLTIPAMEEPVEDVEEPEEDDDEPSEAEASEAAQEAALDAERIRKGIDPVVESVKHLSNLADKAGALSEDIQRIERSLATMKEEMESNLNSVLAILSPGGGPHAPKGGPLTDEEMKKVAVQIANEKRGELRCLSCRAVWVGADRLLGANPTEPWRCPNGCNAKIVL